MRVLDLGDTRRVHLVALGKAAHEMALGALAGLTRRGVEPVSGVIVAAHEAPPPYARLVALVGDHPVPGARSLAAADAIARAVREAKDGDLALVLVSGGTSSLVGAPHDGVAPDAYARRWRELLASGVDVVAMNAERRAMSRWGAGRLGVALAAGGARVLALLASDVPRADPATIGSGPCVPEPDAPPELRARVTNVVVVSETVARGAVAGTAEAWGWDAVVEHEPLAGEARDAGERVAARLVDVRRAGTRAQPCVLVWVGEPTVALPPDGAHGTGGRAQELALAVARALHDAGDDAQGITLLAAGTDGRDGPTSAAGAIVDGLTWRRIAAAGRNPARDLLHHDSHASLGAAGALVPARHTGANVADVVVGLVLPAGRAAGP